LDEDASLRIVRKLITKHELVLDYSLDSILNAIHRKKTELYCNIAAKFSNELGETAPMNSSVMIFQISQLLHAIDTKIRSRMDEL
jgi:hypothetical protein